MKKILQILSVLMFTFISLQSALAYELTETDYNVVDLLDDKIIELIDSRESLSPKRVVQALENFLAKKERPLRFERIIETVIDDIKYEYYLWEYAETAISADDCYEDEYLNPETGYCLAFHEEYEDSDEDYIAEAQHDKSEEPISSEENLVANYSISENEVLLLSGEESEKWKELWELFVTIIPKDYRKDLKHFWVYDDANSDTSAYVEQDENNPKQWNMVVNLSHFDDDKNASTETLIHEFAHVLSLGKSQVKYVPLDASEDYSQKAQADCNTHFVWEWCLQKTSYLHNFIKQFWVNNFAASQDEEEDDFYTWNESNFVTDYAATNPWEDIAESFTYFVLQARPNWSTISDQKMAFFYEYPELVKLRNFVRMRIQK